MTWDPVSLCLGVLIGASFLMLLLLFLAHADAVAERNAEPRPDPKRAALVAKLREKKESPRWTE